MHSRIGRVLFDGTAPLTVCRAFRSSTLEAANFIIISQD
jgi:hypothetical protein